MLVPGGHLPAKCDAEFLLSPYSGREGDSLLKRLIVQLRDGRWRQFRAAVAFARVSGNFPDLLEALRDFARDGNLVQLTFGADRFGAEQGSSDLEAIGDLLSYLEEEPTAEIFLYTEPGRTFHPKIYCFNNDESAFVAIGSSNWTEGGLMNNVEANVLLSFDLTDKASRREFDRLIGCFSGYWREIE